MEGVARHEAQDPRPTTNDKNRDAFDHDENEGQEDDQRVSGAYHVGLIGLVGARPAAARPAAGELLQSIITRITVRNATTVGLCLGFVSTVRADVAYVVTAKHCIQEMSPLVVGVSPDPDLIVTINYANGGTGSGRFLYWHPTDDVLVIVASFTLRPASYRGQCSACLIYTSFSPDQTIPILSVLSTSGGTPVTSNGLLLTDSSGESMVVLPSAPGTSGAPVLDMGGALVGIVSATRVRGGAEAGVFAVLATAPHVDAVVTFAVAQFEAQTPGSRTLVPPAASPPPLPLDTRFAGFVNRVSEDQTRFMIVLYKDGRQVFLTTSPGPPCTLIKEYDQVVFRVAQGSDLVVLVTRSASCSMRITEIR
jgi:hypothetical protein